MIYSIVPLEIIFSENPEEISYIKKDGVTLELSDKKIRRIISTNPIDYMKDLTFTD